MSSDAHDTHRRLHALDGLRASMMMLGLVLHTAVSYGVFDYGDAWGYKDTSTTFVADIIVIFIHVFRMPIFFVLAGFFAAMLYIRRGPLGLARNRFIRIVVPFVIGWAVLYPLVVGGFIFALVSKATVTGIPLPENPDGGAIRVLFFGNSTLHLWFLYYLVYFYAAALLLAPLVLKLPTGWRTGIIDSFGAIVSRPLLRLVILVPITTLALLSMGGSIRTPGTFVIDPLVLLAYGLYFTFGWLLYSQRDRLGQFVHLAWTQTLIAVLPVHCHRGHGGEFLGFGNGRIDGRPHTLRHGRGHHMAVIFWLHRTLPALSRSPFCPGSILRRFLLLGLPGTPAIHDLDSRTAGRLRLVTVAEDGYRSDRHEPDLAGNL